MTTPNPTPDDLAGLAAKLTARECTCHPDERPEECQHKYALWECWEAVNPDESWKRTNQPWGIPWAS